MTKDLGSGQDGVLSGREKMARVPKQEGLLIDIFLKIKEQELYHRVDLWFSGKEFVSVMSRISSVLNDA